MKKLISLCIVGLMTTVAFSQATTPPPKKSLPETTRMDTIPNVNRNNNDTSSMSQVNKLPDTTSVALTKDTVPSMNDQANNNSQNDSTSLAKKIVSDRVIMKDDHVLVVKKGDSTLLKDSIVLESGAVVTKEGSVKYTSGKTAQLKNGQYITLSNPVDNNSKADSSYTGITDDKVVMKDDKVIVVKKGDSTLLSDSIKLASGTIVKNDATVKFKDGTTTKLKNGQSIALNSAPVEKKSPAGTAPVTATAAAPVTASAIKPKEKVEDKVVMTNEKVFVVKNGDSTLLADSIKLQSGAVVKSDATVRFKDGTTTVLKNGQFIAINTVPAEGKKTKKTTPKKKG